jgi:cerevisin
MKGLLLSALPLLAAGSPVLVDTIHNDVAPLTVSVGAEEVPDSYMVIFKKHVSEKAAAAHHLWVRDIHDDVTSNVRMELKKRSQTSMQDTIYNGLKHTYSMPGLQGYSGHFHGDVIEQVRRHPDVSNPLLLLLSTAPWL